MLGALYSRRHRSVEAVRRMPRADDDAKKKPAKILGWVNTTMVAGARSLIKGCIIIYIAQNKIQSQKTNSGTDGYV
jgi:hypothetical protein